MFIGHFGVGFAAKPLARQTSLGTLFLASQFIDLLWPTLLLLGLESVKIVPGATKLTPLEFTHYPISHSLLGVAVWSILFASVYFVLRRRPRAALVCGALVASHWLLDGLTHQPDLPLGPAGSIGLWSLVAFLVVVHLGNVLGPPPPSVNAIAWISQAQWLLIVWGYWIDRHREPRGAGGPTC